LSELPPIRRYDRMLRFWGTHRWAVWAAKLVPVAIFLVGVYGTFVAENVLSVGAALSVLVAWALASTGAYVRDYSLSPLTAQDRLGLVTSTLERTQRDLKSVADEVAQLRQVAADLEQQARDNQALSQLSSEQLDAWRRDLARRDRNSLYQQLLLFAGGLVAGYLLNQLG
jgi:hypothetical protein